MYQRFEEGKIYHIRYFNLLSNNQRYMLTVQLYIININETTIITQIAENIPPIPSCILRPQNYPQLISLTSATNFLPGKKKPLPMLLAEYASSKEVIYITRTQIQRSSLHCIQNGTSNYLEQQGRKFQGAKSHIYQEKLNRNHHKYHSTGYYHLQSHLDRAFTSTPTLISYNASKRGINFYLKPDN
ncbi:hypothetical protein IGI04_018287 [Brassica rapa subsp. trilocularis]|uniref:Uncharacterized protein n=1 Tax=Brassica rapa subsp. trilocularis TaxID=1813537 RepID=A0ABQ7MCI3_BRACM|nr:hypothetical protein IGI04_018287 [Brassica rapa subsp. trilocularis]